MTATLEHVALIVDGRVRVEVREDEPRAPTRPTGSLLPSLAPLQPPAHGVERPLADVLALVGGELLVAPTAKLPSGRLLHFVGVRHGAPDGGAPGSGAPVGEAPSGGAPVGGAPVGGAPVGRFVAPAELQDAEHAEAVLRTIAELLPGAAPPGRPSWFAPDWFDVIERWIDEVLAPLGPRRTGRVVPHQLRSISAVLRVPTDRGTLWCKAPFRLFRAEARIHTEVARLLPHLVPVLVAVEPEQGWLLMQPMVGAEEEDRPGGVAEHAAPAWADAQLAAVARVPGLLSAGLEHRGEDATVGEFEALLAESPELALLEPGELRGIRSAAERAIAIARELWRSGIPDTLCHGDLHLGNVAWDGGELRIFDWTDGCVSHPFLDAAHLTRALGGEAAAASREAYAARWRAAHPSVDVDRMLAVAPLVDLVFQTVTFERIVRATEPQSAWELGGIVARNLRALPAMVLEAERLDPTRT